MRVIVLTASMTDSPGAIAAALLQASGSSPGGKGANGGASHTASLSTGAKAAHPDGELDGLLALLGTQELVFLVDDADSLSLGAYQLISLLLR